MMEKEGAKDIVLTETEYRKVQHYGRLYLLQEVLKGRPTTIKRSITSLFAPSIEASKLSNPPATEAECRLVEQEKILRLADSFALFLVREKFGDVAATFIQTKKMGHYHIHYAKNEIRMLDNVQVARLLGLCSGNVVKRYNN